MSRPLRIEYPGAFYHVMNRGLNKNAIFVDGDYDRTQFKRTIGEAVDQWKIRVHAFSLMGNHYHMLIETPLGNLSRAMRHIDGVYTQRFNRIHGRDGPLFRGRFKAILVEKESYFLELVRYIHLNGVKAKSCPSPELDFHSSHRGYLHPNLAPPWLERSLVLSHFHGHPSAQEGLHQFVLKGIPDDLSKILRRQKWPAILGAESFVESVQERYLKSQKRDLELPQKNYLLRMRAINPEIVLKIVSETYSKRRTDPQIEREIRWVKIYFLRRYSLLKFNEIGTWVTGKSYKSVQIFLVRNNFSGTAEFSLADERLSNGMLNVAT